MNTSTAITIWDTPLWPGAQLRYFARCGGPHPGPAWLWRPRLENRPFATASSAGVLRNGRGTFQLIVSNARFWKIPWVQSKNLASKLLALASRQLPQDWQVPDRSAYRPKRKPSETQRCTGACYKAANWIHVGQTQGRGKLDL